MYACSIILQASIVATGNANYTIGETFPIMQQDLKQKEVSLSVPKFETVQIVKNEKLSWFHKLIKAFKKLLK